MSYPHTQTHVVVVVSPGGKIWVVGTDHQRCFTDTGAERAIERLNKVVPANWDLLNVELSPIGEALASRTR